MPEKLGKAKVFISWSGGLSKVIAHHLKLFLPRVIQSLDPWVSADDISKGTLWHGAIMKSLQEARFGIIVLTNENVSKPWLHYETGYMTHYIQDDQKGLVSPLLVEVPTTSLEGPMTSLQATNFSRSDMLQLMSDINALLDEPLDKDNLEYYFSNAWTTFEHEVRSMIAIHSEVTEEPEPFDQERVLTQILDTVRELSRRQDADIDLDFERWIRNTRQTGSGDKVFLDSSVLLNKAIRDQWISQRRQARPQETFWTVVDGRVIEVNDPHDGGDQAGGDQATE